jgi:type 1 glutamine amidotransferase
MRNTLNLLRSLLIVVLFPSFWGCAANPPQESPAKIRVLLVTGGHDFEHEQFFKLFADNPDITVRAVEQPNALAFLRPDAAREFDVLALYDYHQDITDEAKADFLAWLKQGKGLLVLHHAIADYQQWPEYAKIIGARYYLKKTVVDGVEKKRSAFKHGMHFKVHVADTEHPVTRGLQDYDFHDEVYKWFDLAEDTHPLLTTDEPESNKVIAWTKTYAAARVVYIQSGHDHFAYEDPNYQRLVRQAIRWADRKK